MWISLELLRNFLIFELCLKFWKTNSLDLLILQFVLLLKFCNFLFLNLVIVLINKEILNHVVKLLLFGKNFVSGLKISIFIGFLETLMLLPSSLNWLNERIIKVLDLFLRIWNDLHVFSRKIANYLLILLVISLFFVIKLRICRLTLSRFLFHGRFLFIFHFRNLIELWLVLSHKFWILLNHLH